MAVCRCFTHSAADDVRRLRMNTKAEQPKGTTAADIGKLVLAAVILVAGIVAYSWFSNDAGVPPVVRLLGVLAALVVSLAIASFTALGRRVRNFIGESQFELRKVVWPTREETIKTTGIIIVVVFVIALLLGLIDLLLKTVILDWLLKL
jgi:preprotein translocase subunit SecE